METTFAHVLNGDVIDVDGIPATVDEIRFHNEPLLSVYVLTERFGKTFLIVTDDTPVTILERGE